jgi:hypothetical protein
MTGCSFAIIGRLALCTRFTKFPPIGPILIYISEALRRRLFLPSWSPTGFFSGLPLTVFHPLLIPSFLCSLYYFTTLSTRSPSSSPFSLIMSLPDSKISIAICGGIGGLSLAIGLLRHPHLDVHIYESAAAFGEIGAGVSFARVGEECGRD